MEENRWEISKIGLINYWWYDEEVFEFSKGRMILRGTNGSGKSVTMQSFIPLLLDGKKTPERLDPFGNKSRKIEDYVLGYGDNIKEENTSYLYMEFFKKETQNYVTVGIGLSAKKGQGVKFWGFVIKDGRRVGKDFLLYKELDNKILLTKQELKNKIGEGGQVVETQKEYMQLVNDNIFGFETLEEYDEFIKLLIEIRTPKLSDGKNFKPSIVTEIISNSLRALSDEDLRPVAESIENMNKTKEQLETLKNSQKAINNIQKYYRDYNECVLYEKAKRYINTNQELKKQEVEERSLRDSVKKSQEDIQKYKEQIEEIGTKIKTNKFQLDELRKDERFNLQKELTETENNIKANESELADKNRNIESKGQEERQKDKAIREEQMRLEMEQDEFKEIEEEVSKKAKEIQYDEYQFRIDDIKNALNKRYNYDSFNNDVKRYIDKIETSKKALEKAHNFELDYDKSLEELDKKRKELNLKNQEVTKSRLELNDAKEKMIENMYVWERENTLLKIDDEDKAMVAQKIQIYGETANFDSILEKLRVPYEKLNSKILRQKVQEESIKAEAENKIEELKQQIEEWKNAKQAEPERSKRIQKNREKLTGLGIDYIPFYNAVDFKRDVSEDIKNTIELALLDMGILDALIVSNNSLQKIKGLGKEFEDKYLDPRVPKIGSSLLDILEITKPENSSITVEEISNILSNISLDENTEGTYVDDEGNYKIGLISGKVNKNEEAKYIGREAKRRYKEKMIQELQTQIEVEKGIIEEQQSKIQKIEEDIGVLKEEYNNFPSKDEMETCYHTLVKLIDILQSIQEQEKSKEREAEEKQKLLKQAKEEVEIATKGIYFTKTLQVFENNLEIAKDFREELFKMEQSHSNISSIYEKMEILKDNLEKIRDDLDNLRYEASKMGIKKRELEEKKRAIEEIMGQDFTELQQKMQECLRLEGVLPSEERVVRDAKSRLENQLENDNKRLLGIEEIVKELMAKNKILQEIFEEELNLKYVIEEPIETQRQARNILSQYSKFEKAGKTLSDYFSILVSKYTENSENLIEYSIAIDELYQQTDVDISETDLSLVYATRNRMDITGFTKGRKVNLIALSKDIEETIEETQSLIEEDDRKLFEDILTNTVGRKIRDRIYHSKEWVKNMNDLMETLNTSSGLSFSLKWKPKAATDETEVDTAELVNILNADSKILKQEEITKIANHFRSKFAKAEEKSKEKGNIIPFYNIMKETLDYRNWFEFEFLFKQGNNVKKTLTNNAFYKLSGGEKAMAMYIPLFAAVYARYESAKNDCPRIISLDEAFAGVDDNNIRDMFRILTKLDLEYIINSQVLWGEYDTIPSLAINELVSDPSSQIVSVIRYRWDGNKRELVI